MDWRVATVRGVGLRSAPVRGRGLNIKAPSSATDTYMQPAPLFLGGTQMSQALLDNVKT